MVGYGGLPIKIIYGYMVPYKGIPTYLKRYFAGLRSLLLPSVGIPLGKHVHGSSPTLGWASALSDPYSIQGAATQAH